VFRSKSPFVAQVNAILQTDETLTDQLATIAAPTLVIVGNQDVLTPRGDSEELADIIPNAELIVISGAAHGLMIEHASTFNREVFGFIDRVESRRSLAVSQ
jgi:pimeloyl-ACP methyl ester carboxylesterase